MNKTGKGDSYGNQCLQGRWADGEWAMNKLTFGKGNVLYPEVADRLGVFTQNALRYKGWAVRRMQEGEDIQDTLWMVIWRARK